MVKLQFIKTIKLSFLISFFFVSSSYAKELYVSTTGSDGVTYESNNISNPWATPQKAWYNAKAADIVYFRGGTYTISSTINTSFNGNDGTEEKPITFMSYPGEQAIFNATVTPAFSIQKDYNYVDNITCNGQGTFWELAEDRGGNYFKIQNCRGSQALFGGEPNYGWVRFRHTDGNHGIVENCVVEGPGAIGNQNTAAVFCFRSQGVKIRYNEFYNFPRGIYYKHTCVGYDTDIEIAYNYIHDCGNAGIWTVSQYADIKHNLFVNADVKIAGGGGGGGDDGNNHGGDYNLVEHNTIYNGNLILNPTWDGDESGPEHNTFKDNLLVERFNLMEYNTQTHYSTTDYNLYPSGTAVQHGRTSYTLSEWQAYYGQDSHSLSGSPTFVGGENPSSISDFALAYGSVGKEAASDGKDIGADISQIGLKETLPPTAPQNLRLSSN
jgi:hypothetical protein